MVSKLLLVLPLVLLLSACDNKERDEWFCSYHKKEVRVFEECIKYPYCVTEKWEIEQYITSKEHVKNKCTTKSELTVESNENEIL